MRASGILLPIFSLPSKHGIGTLGKEAFKFIDFLKESGQSYWQILPIGPTSYGDSPYQSFSSFAGNPYFIDFDLLAKKGLLKESDYSEIKWCSHEETIDYGLLYNERFKVLRLAYNNFDTKNKKYISFCKENKDWLNTYATYMALKYHYEGKPWYEWEDKFKLRTYTELDIQFLDNEIEFWKVVQHLFFKQFYKVKKYANKNNIKIIGDLPIYVATDSADVWTNTEIFDLDENLQPNGVAGYPSGGEDDGQLWGNPLYLWEDKKDEVYKWWFNRLEQQKSLYDVLRLDHFIGFERFCRIPYGDKNGRRGKWVQGPGVDFFKAVKKNVKDLNVIAEDLGELTDGVIAMLDYTGYPGMKVMEFNLDHRDTSGNKPYSYPKNCVAYIGTHDNETAKGWLNSISEEQFEYVKEFLRLNEDEGLVFGMIKSLWSTQADTVIIQMQDFLDLDNSAQINRPSTLGINWLWRLKKDSIDKDLQEKIYKYTKIYDRV